MKCVNTIGAFVTKHATHQTKANRSSPVKKQQNRWTKRIDYTVPEAKGW